MESKPVRTEVRREVRFAVVMYGGVSLAIYINGVVQELFQMVRATATGPGGAPLVPDEDLSGGGHVYRRLGQMLGREGKEQGEPLPEDSPIRTKFVVDILSGTSAGGINAVYLAKALANGQDIEQLSELWVEEGDIEKLINDNESVKRLDGLDVQRPVKSLLNSQRMYRKLLDAFDGMDQDKPRPPEAKSPFVEELDLFVTSTDFYGLPLPLRLFGNAVEEHRHRNVYRLRYTDKYRAKPHNDFVAKRNPFLAFAARSTSAFPFAFDPMKLADIDAVLEKTPKYQHLRGLGRDRERWREFFPAYQQHDFTNRAFVDGGYLDNKPFGYAIDAIASRSSNVPVDRKLIFIDPAPDRPKDRGGEVPNAIENVAAVFTLPRYETIREDLQRILHRNRLIERTQTITSSMEEDVRNTQTEGVAYRGYHRLRVSAVSDEIAGIIARAGKFDPDSDEFFFINYLVRAWRENAYTAHGQEEKGNEFLARYDLPYHLRRLNFIFGKIDQLYDLNREEPEKIFDQSEVTMPETDEEKTAFRREVRSELTKLRAQLSSIYTDLYRTREELHTFEQENPIAAPVRAMKLWEDLDEFLKEPDEASREAKAQYLVSEKAGLFDELAETLARHIEERTKDAADRCRNALRPTGSGEERPNPADHVRKLLWPYYDFYERYDLISFPILYATEVGEETDPVEVVRISPEDAPSLIDERDVNEQRRKLAGTAIRGFGAFFEHNWRRNDILWGRLDGAERIITMLLSSPAHERQRDKLISEAQLEILADELETRDRFSRFLIDAMPRVNSAEPSAATLRELAKGIRSGSSPEGQALLSSFGETYEVEQRMDPERAVRTLSRSTTVVGEILENIAEGYRLSRRVPVTWIARLGRVFWGLVEVAVPHSLPNLLFRHWLQLLYLFEALLIVGGTLLAKPGVQLFGMLTLGITAAVHAGTTALGDFMRGERKPLRLLKVLLFGTVSLGAAFLIGVGAYALIQAEPRAALLANLNFLWENLRFIPALRALLFLVVATLLVLAVIGADTVFGLRKRLLPSRSRQE